MGTVLHCDN